ncbi:MAG: electron transfer flavoprotein subunit beta/FixA family protein [Clostridiales bacterium]|nr:electron transfer flavoprotein subunit beta/FixA family protein [Clostridiales bacterium]
MNILVCIKQVPGTTNVEVDPVTGVLKRDGVQSKLNPYDLYAIETALTLRESYGGTVDTITMGPDQAKSVILESIYMGVDGGTVVSDRRFAGSDVLATSYTLAQAIKVTNKSYDIILCGKQTTDGDTAQVGSELAELLSIPHITYVNSIVSVSDRYITVRSGNEYSVITSKIALPCLICVDSDINTPRLPSYKRKKYTDDNIVRFMSLDNFADRDESHYGLKGSATQVERVFSPDKKKEKTMIEGTSSQLSDSLYELLKDKKFI